VTHFHPSAGSKVVHLLRAVLLLAAPLASCSYTCDMMRAPDGKSTFPPDCSKHTWKLVSPSAAHASPCTHRLVGLAVLACAGTHFSRHATARKFPSEHKHARTCKAKCGLGHAKCCHCVVLLRPAIALLRLPGPPPPHPCDPARHVRGPRHVSKRCARPRGSCGAVRQADAWQSHGSMMRDVTAWGLDGYAFDSGLVPKPSKDPSAGGFQTSYSLQLHTTRIN
jgi:hypothetical protein